MIKKIIVSIFMVFIFYGLALAEEFCDRPLNIDFFTDRSTVESIMTKMNGPIFSKKGDVTIWYTNRKHYACFFRSDKMVGLSIIATGDEVPENIKRIKDVFIMMDKAIREDPDWKFERNFDEEVSSIKMMGMKYGCKRNQNEKVELTISREMDKKLVSIDIFSYLTGFGLSEH